MNKKRLGKFLMKLRNDNIGSQEKLSDIFRENYFEVSKKTISDWELGKTIPDIEKLGFLSNLYGVSIDEILDGELRTDIDYFKEYLFANENWLQMLRDKKDSNAFLQKEIIKVNKRFKILLNKIINDDYTRNDENEFKFLFEHYYELTWYANDYSNLHDDYLKLLEAIKNKLNKMKYLSCEEKYFEITKFIVPTSKCNIKFYITLDDIVNAVNLDSGIGKRFKMLDWWEKDMLLMCIQKGDVVFDQSRCGANTLKVYEERYGREFDRDEYVRRAVKFMIDNGACLNYQFINIILKKHEKQRIIDKIEELYLRCIKPLPCSYMDNEKIFTRYAENNRKNRFISNYYHRFKITFNFLKLDFEELYKFIWKYNPNDLPNEMIKFMAKQLNINTEREMKYIKADLNNHSHIFKLWNDYRLEEEKIEKDLLELRMLENKLENGEIYETIVIDKFIGGNDFDTLIEHFDYWRTFVSLQELRKMRDEEKTKELLENLSSYSLDDIRRIYMQEEERVEGEFNE